MRLLILIFAITLAWQVPASTQESPTGPGTIPTPPVVLNPNGDDIECLPYITGTLTTAPGVVVNGVSVTKVRSGDPVTLTWSVSIPPGCIGIKLAVNEQAVGHNGSLDIHPLTPTAFRLTATKDAQQVTLAEVSVTVALPRVVHIKGNTREWRDLLVYALSDNNPHEHPIVRLAPNVNMDLSPVPSIWIKKGATLTGDQVPGEDVWAIPGGGAEANIAGTAPPSASLSSEAIPGRSGLRLGPRLYTTAYTPEGLFWMKFWEGDGWHNVHMSGFRLEGRHADPDSEEKDTGILVDSCRGVEIDNMELQGWSGMAIHVVDGFDRLRFDGSPRVHHNYIHDNKHHSGYGYGVDVGAGAAAMIERNLFDGNRHAIAASGKPGTTYIATENLVLKAGGVHGTFLNPHTHQFDVHGTENCTYGAGTLFGWLVESLNHIWNCGDAGYYFAMTSNTFQYVRDNAVKFRGKPEKTSEVKFNVFAHDDLDDAVARRTDENMDVKFNLIDSDTYGQYGVCDFDGDGRDDLFLPTGRTWWYSSAGKMQWVFLNSATEILSQLGVGYFDGDKRCDVIASRGNSLVISSGGTGPWTVLPGEYTMPFDQLRFIDYDTDGTTDIFWRTDEGQWRIAKPTAQGWRDLASSGFPLTALRFGDFDNDNTLDVLSMAGGHWSYSPDAVGEWRALDASMTTPIALLIIGDVDGNGGDDIVRFVRDSSPPQQIRYSGKWQVAWGGRGGWKDPKPVNLAPWGTQTRSDAPVRLPEVPLLLFGGHFDDAPGYDLLHVDYNRLGRLYSAKNDTVELYSLYPY